jgi:hypothetical protein
VALRDPLFFEVSTAKDAVADRLDQRYLFVPQNVKECYL